MNRPLTLSLLALICLLLAGGSAHASSPQRASAALADAEALLGSGAGSAQSGGGREATVVLRDLAIGLDQLRGTDRRRGRQILKRPSDGNDQDSFGLEDPSSPLCDSNFCVHWGTDPKHAPNPTDVAPADGRPDYIDAVLAAAQTSFAIENGSLGWRRAKSDGVRGGGGEVDIYAVDLGASLFGYAAPDPGQSGRSRSAYLVIDNDYAGFGGPPLDFMRVTIAHEYNHILQFAYDTFADVWLFESTATWVEDRVFPAINDYLNFVSDFSSRPHVPLAEKDSRAVKLYGSAMWNHWLSSNRFAKAVLDTWLASPSASPPSFALSAYTTAIRAAGGKSFSRDFARFAAETAEWNASASFPDPGLYPEVKRAGKLTNKKRMKLDHTAYKLFDVKRRGNLKLIGKVESRVRSAVALVARTGPGTGGAVTIKLKYLGRGGRAAVRLPNAGQYSRVTAVLINADGRVRGSSRNYSRDKIKFKAKLKR